MIETEYFKKQLKEEEDRLINELDDLGVRDKNIIGNWQTTPADRAQNIESKDELADRMEEIEEREAGEVPLEDRLKEVRHALSKMADNTYGICEINQEPIEEARLKANPAARTCLKHLDQEENLPPIN